MKATYLFVLFAAGVFISSCKNQEVQPQSKSQGVTGPIVAKWNIAKDSTAEQFTTTMINAHVYVGTVNDYYDFRADGKCYIYENGAFDTLGYKIVANDRLEFTNSYDGAIINPLTSHSAKVDFIVAQGPGMGTYSKTVFLTK